MFIAAENIDMDVNGQLLLLNSEPLEVNKTYTLDATRQWQLAYLDASVMKGASGGLPVLHITTLQKSLPDTIPNPTAPPQDQLPDDYKAFLKRNPSVQNLHWRNDSIFIKLKSGITDRYASNKTASAPRTIQNGCSLRTGTLTLRSIGLL
jgi:hypothetical protein